MKALNNLYYDGFISFNTYKEIKNQIHGKKVVNPETGRKVIVGGTKHKQIVKKRHQELQDLISRSNKLDEEYHRLNEESKKIGTKIANKPEKDITYHQVTVLLYSDEKK